MSKIAEALAKAKERTGQTTAPFMFGAPVQSEEAVAKKNAALRRARRLQRFWLVLCSVALGLTGFVLWVQFAEEIAKAPGESAAPPVEVSVSGFQAPAKPSRIVLVNEAPVAVVLPDEAGNAAGASAVIAPAARLELQALVDAWIFTAVMPGERPRLVYKGSIVNVGQRVEGELVFAGIHDGSLVFNDARGVIYLRRN